MADVGRPKKTAHAKLYEQLQVARAALALAAIHAEEVKADRAFDTAAIKHPKSVKRKKPTKRKRG